MKEWSKIMRVFAENLVTTAGVSGFKVNFTVAEDTEPVLKCGMKNYGATVLVGLADGINLVVDEEPEDVCFMLFNGEIIVFEGEPINIC